MKNLITLIALITVLCHPAKTPAQSINLDSHTTRAVVIGISDYQSPQIPDLQFADRDAEAFSEWLKSAAGGGVPADNIILLTNEKATNGKISTALYWLLDATKEDDTAIFYFSGHGDVEAKTRSQTGFLLAHDSPPTNYIGSAVNLRDVQDFVSTLSIETKARVVIVTDACHAGKLAGTAINGPQATAQNLSQQFANEVKIMSCQPNEFSLEGEQWGGGRGVFSFHLVEGLTGLADKNADGAVNLFEIGRYLEDKVPTEAAPHSQMPMTVGDRQTPVSLVNAESLAALNAQKAEQQAALLATNSKGLSGGLFGDSDSSSLRLYADFQAALDRGELLRPAGRSAADYYAQLAEIPEFKPLLGLMKRNLAAGLIDEVQQALNALLDNDPYEANNWKYNPEKYLEYPEYLQQAMNLLGEKNFIHRSLLAKKHYFEGYNLVKNIGDYEGQPIVRDSLKAAAKVKYLESLRIEPGAAYVCYAVGSLYFFNSQTDSMTAWMAKAVELSPGWLLPYLDAVEEISSTLTDTPLAEAWLMKAKAWQPTSYLLSIRLAWLNQWQGKAAEANAICHELTEQRPDIADAWSTLANTHFWLQNEYAEAVKYGQQALLLQPNHENALGAVSRALARTEAEKAVKFCEKQLLMDSLSTFTNGYLMEPLVTALIALHRFEEAEKWIERMANEQNGLLFQRVLNQSEKGRIRLQQNRLGDAEIELHKSLEMDDTPDPVDIQTLALLGEVKNRQNKPAEAEAFFNESIVFVEPYLENAFKNEAYFLYGRFLVQQNRIAEAQTQFENALKISPKTWHYALGMALMAAKKGQKTAALDWLEKSVGSFYFDETAILTEPLFKKIRKTKRFKDLMEKYFPDQTKD